MDEGHGDHRSSCKVGGQLLLKTAKSASFAPQSHKVMAMATDLTLDAQSEDLMEDGLGTLHRKALTILKRIRDV